MKLSRRFVSDYIDLPKDLKIEQIAEDMTSVGNEYDDAGKLINCTNLVVGEVIECINHPDSDHLHVCMVNVGSEVLNIVCGAPNVREGIKVVVALAGAILPGGEIKKGMIRGVESNGMLCSKAELGLDNKFLEEKDKTGIHELPDNAEIGTDAIKALNLDDEVIDFELTSNRGDLLSILGMAYELGAIYKKDVKEIDLSYTHNDENVNDEFKVEVKTGDCPLFLAKKVKNVVIKESPDFIKERLIASGIRPINNVVDISNYVMLETGQPLHYYDAKSLGDTLIVRNALDGEKLTTLDDIERTLTTDDIVISDKEKAVGLAGVMGGLSTEVEPSTTDIIIESAIFDKVKIRRTSKKILRSEASNRFEKGLDPNRTYMAIERSCALLQKYACGTVLDGMVKYDKTIKEEKVIDIKLEKIDKVLGISIPKNEVIEILKSLAFKVEDKDDYLTVTVPTRRLDISIVEDLIEEVGRIYGMDNIKGKLPVLKLVNSHFDRTKREIKNKLINLGLNETLSYSLIPNSEAHKFTTEDFTEITLNDPMSEDRNTLRYSLLYSLKEIYLYNKARNNSDISIFEVGKGFYKENDCYKEDLKLAVLMTGDYYLDINNTKVDFYTIKGVLEELLDYLGYNGRYSLNVSDVPEELHPGQSASILMQGKKVGVIGKLHPNVIKDDVYVFELNLTKLLSNRGTRMSFKEIPKYPIVKKDVAFIVDNNVTVESVMKEIKKAGGRNLINQELFDIYVGDNVGVGKKSLAFSLYFQDDKKTLTEEEVMESFNNIIKKVTESIPATLRDN